VEFSYKSAVSTTLPAFSAERGRLQLSIDICCKRRRSAANPQAHAAAVAVERRDMRTDRRLTVSYTLLRIQHGQRR